MWVFTWKPFTPFNRPRERDFKITLNIRLFTTGALTGYWGHISWKKRFENIAAIEGGRSVKSRLRVLNFLDFSAKFGRAWSETVEVATKNRRNWTIHQNFIGVTLLIGFSFLLNIQLQLKNIYRAYLHQKLMSVLSNFVDYFQ